MDDQVQATSGQETMEAQMDGFDDGAFASALLDSGGEDKGNMTAGQREDALGHQPAAEQQQPEGAADGLENQQPEGESEETEAQGTQTPSPQEETPPEPAAKPQQAETVPLTVGGQQIPLPAGAVQALSGVLGQNPVELLEKGMNYDAKGARELSLLDEFAKAAGLTRQQYVDQLERTVNEQRVADEMRRVAAELPEGTPEEAVRVIAEQRMQQQRAEKERAHAEAQRQIDAGRQRIQDMVEQTRQTAVRKAWDAYEALTGAQQPWDVPDRVYELVREGRTPTEAHYAYQAELLQQQLSAANKQMENKQKTPGSMQGAGADESDPFLRGLLG